MSAETDMPIIDAHVHLKHGDAAGTEYTAGQIVRTMDAAGIERSVVFAMSTSTAHSIAMADTGVGQFPGRLIPYVYVLPDFERPVLPEIEDALAHHGARGIKIHEGRCRLNPRVIGPVLDLAAQYDAPCLIDCKGNLAAMTRLATDFPRTSLIIAHIGRYLSEDADLLGRFIRLAEGHANVLIDVSGVALVAKIADAVRRLGSDRVIWGTDGPQEQPDTAAFARREL
ncbi:MAG: amidohydrolase family protein, partial [Pirellulales bacterium]